MTASDERAIGTQAIRVLIADDQSLFRRGLHAALRTEAGIVVVAEAENGEEALVEALALAPDVVLMDVRMPKVNGIESAKAISEQLPATKILVLTVSDDEEDLYEALKAGACGYLLKDVSIEEIADAIRAVVTGQSLISPSMAAKLLDEFAASMRLPQVTGHELAAPTTEEFEVLSLVAKGRTNPEIADYLHIPENAVRGDVRSVLEKLHSRHRTET